MSNSFGFRPYAAPLTISASTASASVSRPAAERNAEHISIYNAAAKTAFVRVGVGAQTAILGDFAVPAGQVRILRCAPGDDTVAAILDTGAVAANVYVQSGDGWS